MSPSFSWLMPPFSGPCATLIQLNLDLERDSPYSRSPFASNHHWIRNRTNQGGESTSHTRQALDNFATSSAGFILMGIMWNISPHKFDKRINARKSSMRIILSSRNSENKRFPFPVPRYLSGLIRSPIALNTFGSSIYITGTINTSVHRSLVHLNSLNPKRLDTVLRPHKYLTPSSTCSP
ncbi:hypothetical protein BD410DRAFT_79530 [Rickenella mellea]|uniref:Uncharacterized protein n=1 Tax=Rickenella mellea TaxID=50990 RepID=A0A4Y7PL80_9AGAM|nr:hypothetical protein BD410DRAFT_79530 [Rickenella mellea]